MNVHVQTVDDENATTALKNNEECIKLRISQDV